MSNCLTTLVARGARRHPEREVFYRPTPQGQWVATTWEKWAEEVDYAALALMSLGLEPQECVAVFSANRPEVLTTDFAAYANRAIPVSIYSTSSLEQVVYILNDTRARFIVVGDDRQLDIARQARSQCPHLQHIVVVETAEESLKTGEDTFVSFLARGAAMGRKSIERLNRLRQEATEDDIATLIYTSGTTGEPKGAILTQKNFTAALDIHRERLTTLSKDDTSLCFLPLSHIFEKAWTYFCLDMSIRVWINLDPRIIQESIRQVRPSCMCSVPRFWEKAYAGVQEKISEMSWLQRALISRALKVGRKRNLRYARIGRKAPWWLEREYRFFNARVFSRLTKAIGIENGNIFPTAGAPLSSSIVEFFHACGVNIMIGYGLSETTATVTCFPTVGYEIGSVGTPIPRVQVKIGKDNEILVKGPTVMQGYYNKPAITAETFTPDGWLRTGDAGSIDRDGSLIITERLKDLFKTSNGKYIAPQAIESRLGEDKYIEQVAVIGDKRKYVTAIIIPAFEALKEYARKKHIRYRSLDDLVKNSDIRSLIEQRIAKLQNGLAGFEKIKKFTLLPREFTMENGELTNTLKIRRPVINSHYSNEIEAMYA